MSNHTPIDFHKHVPQLLEIITEQIADDGLLGKTSSVFVTRPLPEEVFAMLRASNIRTLVEVKSGTFGLSWFSHDDQSHTADILPFRKR